ncbi:MAG TPA: N,N-dimethylformamidase beta subunit family domain-containing protein [Ktedonobacterales bacterium]
MRSQGRGRRAHQMFGRAVGGWQRIALLCVVVFTGLGVSVGSAFVAGVPRVAAASNAIQVENSYPGDPTWDDFSANLDPTALSGYSSPISVNHGQTVNFYVTTTAASVTIDIYRTGWYGGTGARFMERLGTFTGQHQAIPNPNTVTGMVSCNWQKTTSLAVPSNWTTGVYLAKLIGSSGDKSFIFFVVRNDGGHEDFDFQTSVTTYQAYNTYGGTSLYNNNTNGSIYPYAHATKVSFDRPFNPGDSNGAGHYLWWEYPMIRWAEKNGFDMTYTTNIDTDLNTNPLTNHKAFLSVGHDEYWSKAMRDNVAAAINAGVNVGFFSANSAYWQIRLEPNAAGIPDRVEVGYKDFATIDQAPGPDPQWNVNNSIVTTRFRDDPVNRPENAMIGVMFRDQNKSVERPYVVTNASSWVFANTGFVNGSSVPGIVGYEYDATFPDNSPPGLITLSSSPVDGMNGPSNSNSTIYTAPSGARVFAAGTIAWSYGLDNFGGRSTANAGIQQTTANIFYNFNGGTPPPPPPPPPAGTYLQDNFESGNLTQWTGPLGTGSAGVATGASAHNGLYAAALTTPSGTGQYVTLTKDLVNGPGANTYTRFYFQVTNPSVSSTLVSATDKNGNNMWVASYDGGSHGLDIYFWNGARTRFDFYSRTGSIQANTWYGLEINMNEVSSGGAQIWLDGTSIGTVSGDLSATNTISTLNLWDDAASTTNDFDDVIVSNHYNGTVASGGAPTSFSPSGLAFGDQVIGTTSAAKSVTFTNTSTATIHVSSVVLTGVNVSDFIISADACTGAALAVDASCSVSVEFAPTTAGSRSASLSFSDDALGSPQSLSLSGTAVNPGPIASFNTSSLSFGSQGVGTTSNAQTVTLTNTGTLSMSVSTVSIGGANPGDFAISADTCTGATVAINATCSVSITFTPTAMSNRSAALSFSDNAPGNPHTISLSGKGVQVLPAGTYLQDGFESGSLALWSAPAGTGTATAENTLVNSGTYALAMTNGANQYVTISQDLVGGPQTHTFARYYFRITNASLSATMATATDSSGNNVWAVLYDAGSHGLDIYFWNGARTRFDFYTKTNIIQANTWYSLEIELNEATAGAGTVWLNGTSLGGVTGDLSATNALSRLYLWNDAATTTYFDDVVVSNKYNGPLGSTPAIGITPASVSFGNQGVGATSNAQMVTVTNTGTASLHITGVALTGPNAADFAVANNTCTGTSMVPGASCTVSVTFTPGAQGGRSATLSFSDDAPASPQTVALSGTGTVPTPGISFNPTSVNFDRQETGASSAPHSVTVTNNGSATLHITSVTLTGANPGDFAISADACTGATVAINATCSVSVTFGPTVTGSRTAALSFSDDAPASPQTVALSGSGTQPGIYLQDGFESGDISQWSSGGGSGTATTETTVVNSGTYALAMTNGANQYATISQNLYTGPQAHTFTRIYFRITNASLSATMATATDSSGNNVWAILYDAGSHGLDIYFWNGARSRFDFYTPANVLQANTWYALEIELNESTTGAGTVWLNGTSLGGVTGDLSATNDLSRLYLWNDAATTTYFDDVVVSNQYNGLLP